MVDILLERFFQFERRKSQFYRVIDEYVMLWITNIAGRFEFLILSHSVKDLYTAHYPRKIDFFPKKQFTWVESRSW